MIKYNKAFCAIFVFLLTSSISYSQNTSSPSTNSPYTRYGFGQLSDQSFGNGRAMGGLGYGLRDKYHVNPLNPASYTAIDSLTFLLEGGFSLQNTNLSDGNIKKNAKNTSFDYIAMQFRLNRRFATSVGFLPFSNVGYKISSESSVGNIEETTAYNSFNGTGGLHQLYWGLGFKIINNLSIGTNVSYLFGTIDHASFTSYRNNNGSETAIDASQISNQIKVNDYKLDFGLQYTHKFGKKHVANLGLIYSLKHKINNKAYHTEQLMRYSSSYGGWYPLSQNIDTIKNGFELPHMFGVGITYIYNQKLTVGVDYTFQKWGETVFFGETGQLKDCSKISLGLEYLPNNVSRNYLNRTRYRAGFYYKDPYIKVQGENGNWVNGAHEYGASIGLGLPLFRSLLNISGEYVRVKPKTGNLIEENVLRVNLGITFNERWFAKWKVQ